MFVPGESATVAPSADSGGSGAPSETTDAFQASLEKYRAQKIKKGQKEHFEVALAELLTQIEKREEDKAKAAAKKKQKDLEKARTRVAKPVEHKGTWALQPPPSWVEEVPMNKLKEQLSIFKESQNKNIRVMRGKNAHHIRRKARSKASNT